MELALARMHGPFMDPSSVAAEKMRVAITLLETARSGQMGRYALESAASLLIKNARWDTPPHIARLCDKDAITDNELLTICRLLADELDAQCASLPPIDEDEVLDRLPPVPYDFFVSWAHATAKPYATELARELRGDGYATFFSEWFLGAEEKASAEITRSELSEAIELCKSMVLVVDRGAIDSSWVKWEVAQFLQNRRRLRRLFVVYFDAWSGFEDSVLEGWSDRNRLKAIFQRYEPNEERRFLLALRGDPRVFFVREFDDINSLDPRHSRAAFQILQCLANEPPEFRTARYELNEYSRVTLARDDRFRLGCLTLVLIGLVLFLLRHSL